MSGHSYSNPCPNCGKDLQAYSDHKPHDYVSGDCLHCGFQYWTANGQMTLEDLNAQREDYAENADGNLKPLKKLPKIEEGLIWN